ncbi:2122_t:CDS:2, partial [Acaulospora morrowiae]
PTCLFLTSLIVNTFPLHTTTNRPFVSSPSYTSPEFVHVRSTDRPLVHPPVVKSVHATIFPSRTLSLIHRETIIHLTDTLKLHCPIYKFTNYEGLYVAHVGHIEKELSCVKRFYSYFKCSQSIDSITRTDNTDDHYYLMTSKVVAYKVELNYVDPLKEYLNVVIDKETGETMEIFVEMDNELDLIAEPTFEDVITLWIAVLLWGVRMIVNQALSYKKFDFRVTKNVYKM